jgi:hypothetical protein
MAVDAVHSEPVSRRIPANREKYREFYRGSGGPRSASPVKTASSCISHTSGMIRNRELKSAYQGIFDAIRIPIRDSSGSIFVLSKWISRYESAVSEYIGEYSHRLTQQGRPEAISCHQGASPLRLYRT